MVRRMDTSEQGEQSSDEPLPTRLPAVPLVLDESPMQDFDDEDQDDIEEEIIRQRVNAARTLFHQPRGDSDTVNSTRSLYDSDVVYVTIHGRRYCEDYYMPNDEEEQTRMQILHGVYLHLLGNKLTTVPLHKPKKILDIGTGTGDWAMAMGDEYPDAEVIGTDIAKIQPSAVPLNVYFEIDDAEEDGGWTWPENEFDFVHFRTMAGAFNSWQHIYREAFKHLKPGGWIEVLDFDNHGQFLSYFNEESEVARWLNSINEAMRSLGKPRGAAHLQPHLLIDAGFKDVTSTTKMIPMGVWPCDKNEQRIGKLFLVAQLCGVEALCLRPLAEQLGWDVDEIRSMCSTVTAAVRAVALDPEKSKGLGFNVRILTGRKPGASEEDKVEPDEKSMMGDSVKTMTNGEPVRPS